VVIGVVHLHEAGEDILRLQLGADGLERFPDTCEGERARTIEGGDADGGVMTGDDGERLLF